MHKQKLKKVVDFTFKNTSRETITEVEVFINTAKAFLDDDKKVKNLDSAFASLRDRILDIGGEESRRLQRYLDCWEVEQVSEELDWVEYNLPDRLEFRRGKTMANEEGIHALEDLGKAEFTEDEVNQGMLETATGQKIVTVAGLGDVILRYPTRDDEMRADVERSRAFTNFLLDGLKTEDEMKRIAEERGIWTEKDDQELENSQSDMVRLQVEISQTKAGNKRKKLQKELLDARGKWVDTFSCKNAIFAHTVENKASNIYWQYLTFRCAFKDADGERFWATYKDFLDEANSSPSTVLLTEFLAFYNGLSENFFALWAGEETEQPESGGPDGE